MRFDCLNKLGKRLKTFLCFAKHPFSAFSTFEFVDFETSKILHFNALAFPVFLNLNPSVIYIFFLLLIKKSRKKANVNGKVKAWVQKNGKLYKIQHSEKCQIKVQTSKL